MILFGSRKKRWVPILAFLILFMNCKTFAQEVKQSFAASGTFICPAGVTSITIESWGAGGAGGGVDIEGSAQGGSGGGGGAYSKVSNYTVVPGNSYSITVGVGGLGIIGDGGDGGNSFFGSNICVAKGGKGGLANNSYGGGVGGSGTYSGGNGSNSNSGLPGGGGSGAGSGSKGNNGFGASGGSAVIDGGAGGDGGNKNPSEGGDGSYPGGGGGGAKKGSGKGQRSGGAGANGMVVITYTANACTTLYWAGLGSSISGGTSGLDFNSKANWSVSPSSYIMAGASPGACNDIVINVALSKNLKTVQITFSQSATTIKNLTYNVTSGGSAAYNDNVYESGLSLENATLYINGNSNLYCQNGVYGITTQLTMDCKNNNCLLVYGGSLNTDAINSAGGGGECIVYPFSNPVHIQGVGKFVLKGNALLKGLGDDANPELNKPATLVFDGTGSQTITNNNSNGYPIFLAFNTIIGETNTPTVILTGSNSLGFKSINNLSIKSGAILEIDANQSLDRNISGTPGTMTLGAGSKIILKGNNFPSGYNTAYNLDATSTVEYAGSNGISQSVRGITYGNLILTNPSATGNSTKSLSASISVRGNFSVDPFSTFEQSNYNVSRTPSGGIFSLAANAIHNLSGAFPTGFTTIALNSLSTTNYNGTGSQNVIAATYGNLNLANKGTKTLNGSISVAGDLSISGQANLKAGSYTISLFGNWSNTSNWPLSPFGFSADNSTVNFLGTDNVTINGSVSTSFNNLIINKSATSNTVTNAPGDKGFTASTLTISKGNLQLQSIENDYTISGNVIVAPAGILTHSAPWDPNNKALRIGGNLDITGIFNPTVRSHVAMFGTGSKTIQTGTNPASTLSILTFSNGNYSANGPLKANQEVWAMFYTGGSFSTASNNVTFQRLLNMQGTVNINGGTLTILSDADIGFMGSTGTLNISDGTLQVEGNFINEGNAQINVSNNPNIKVKGDWINNGQFNPGTSTVTFYGSSDENISGSAPLSFYNLKISGVNVVQSINLSILNNLDVNSGILDMQNFTCNRVGTGGIMTVYPGTIIKLRAGSGGTDGSNFPSGYASYNLMDGSTIYYSGIVNQKIFAGTSYSNLNLSNPGIKTASGNLTVRGNLTLLNNSVLNAGNYLHSIAGNWVNDASENALQFEGSTFRFNGTTPQTIGGNFGTSFNAISLDNNSTVNIAPLKRVSVYESITATGPGKTLNTNDQLTLKSLKLKTAWVGDFTGSNINGKAIVERFMSAQKGWRFVSLSTIGSQTIKDSWQEGAVNQNANPIPGYGIQLTGNMANWEAMGFDRNSSAPSMKYYDVTKNDWVGIANTIATPISNTKGYMVFVRGDRLATSTSSTPTETNLRSNGNLKIGSQPVIQVQINKFESIGNPYPSPVDFIKITKGSGISPVFYLWDPFLSGSYNVGGYQTFSAANDWYPVPGGTTAHPSASANTTIQSGEAFFVKGNPTGNPSDFTIQFTETAKVGANPPTFSRPFGATGINKKQILRASLINQSGSLVDGNAVAFSDQFSNEVDGNDALKFANSSENFGIKRSGKLLGVEARNTVQSGDTVYYSLSNLLKQTYTLVIAPLEWNSDVTAVLIDKYNKTAQHISLTDSNFISIAVNNEAGSFAEDRLKIVFSPAVVLPVNFSNITAYQKNETNIIEWHLENEKNIREYIIERSGDGSSFIQIGNLSAQLNGNYQFADQSPLSGWNYYRVKSKDVDEKTGYSQIVKVNRANESGGIHVFPNPVSGNKLNIQMKGRPAGIYKISLINSVGQEVQTVDTKISSNQQIITLDWNNKLPHGIYSIKITGNDSDVKIIQVTY